MQQQRKSDYHEKENLSGIGKLPDATELGPVHLSVTDGKRALLFYRDILGLKELPASEEKNVITLGTPAGTELAVLHPGAKEAFPRGRTGLYHFALAVPNVLELARVVKRLSSLGYDHYPTDHVVSKSDYLWDPDRNGIEIYTETPEDVDTFRMDRNGFYIRDKTGALRSGRDPMDLDWLYGHLGRNDSSKAPIPDGTSMGHVHLHVADLEASNSFYCDVLGYDRLRYSPSYQISDLTLKDYEPHRIALNTWAGEGAPPSSPAASGLRHFTVILPKKSDLDAVIERVEQSGSKLTRDPSDDGGSYALDPSENRIHLTVTQ